MSGPVNIDNVDCSGEDVIYKVIIGLLICLIIMGSVFAGFSLFEMDRKERLRKSYCESKGGVPVYGGRTCIAMPYKTIEIPHEYR